MFRLLRAAFERGGGFRGATVLFTLNDVGVVSNDPNIIVREVAHDGSLRVAEYETVAGVLVDGDSKSIVSSWTVAYSLTAPLVGVFARSASEYSKWSPRRIQATLKQFSKAYATTQEAAEILGVEHITCINGDVLNSVISLSRSPAKGIFS